MSSSVSAPRVVTHESGLDTLLRDIRALEIVVAQWDDQQQSTVHALKESIDALNKAAFTRLIRALKDDPATLDVLKNTLSDEVIYAVLRHHDIVKPTLHERIETALESVRPYLASHGGNVEIVHIDAPDSVTIRLLGSCDGCPAAGLTLSAGVEKAINEACPEITKIKKAKGGPSAKPPSANQVNYVSPFANANDAGWLHAAKVEDIPEGNIKCIEIDGRSVLLSKFGERVTCFENSCAHLGMPLDLGLVNNGIITCPHHAFEYSLETGECLTAVEVQLQTHAVRVVGSQVEIKLS